VAWVVEQADALEFLRRQPDGSVDLVFTSPPYLKARTYGIGAGRGLEDWTAWMVSIVTECVRVSKGLTAVVCEGQTREYRYLPAPFLLMADLHRAGFNLRKPAVYHRVGIPGSGGPDWLRNDWEPVVCVSREGRLPWSCPTACGKPPRFGPGGDMSHRVTNGDRRNQWGRHMNSKNSQRKPDGTFQTGHRPSHREAGYGPPVIANPGNIIRTAVGGNAMGHSLAHDNEAPFPLKLAEFFVLSFCPPNGTVCDPFTGSGTTCHAAEMHGRNFIGCDVRQSQVALTTRRMATVTKSLFASAVG
jgi:hypothetical protein